jgi:hypothetical protein
MGKRYCIRIPVDIRCIEEWDEGSAWKVGVLGVEIEGRDRQDALGRLQEAMGKMVEAFGSSVAAGPVGGPKPLKRANSFAHPMGYVSKK